MSSHPADPEPLGIKSFFAACHDLHVQSNEAQTNVEASAIDNKTFWLLMNWTPYLEEKYKKYEQDLEESLGVIADLQTDSKAYDLGRFSAFEEIIRHLAPIVNRLFFSALLPYQPDQKSSSDHLYAQCAAILHAIRSTAGLTGSFEQIKPLPTAKVRIQRDIYRSTLDTLHQLLQSDMPDSKALTNHLIYTIKSAVDQAESV